MIASKASFETNLNLIIGKKQKEEQEKRDRIDQERIAKEINKYYEPKPVDLSPTTGETESVLQVLDRINSTNVDQSRELLNVQLKLDIPSVTISPALDLPRFECMSDPTGSRWVLPHKYF